MLEIRLFGTLEMNVDGVSLLNNGIRRRDALMLAYLLLEYPDSVPRAILAEDFWPDSPDPLETLKNSLSRLKRDLGEEYRDCIDSKSNREVLQLDLQNVWADVVEFNRDCKSPDPEAREKARLMYSKLLPGCKETWLFAPRENCHEQWRTLAAKLAAEAEGAAKAEKDWERPAALWDSLYQDNPCAEDEFDLQKLMPCLTNAGRRDRLVTVYENHRERLLLLGRQPRRETTFLYEQLRQPVSPPKDAAVRFTPPAPVGKLLCREQEVARCTELLRSDGNRLMTLLGPGGVGKTRLAAELASRLKDEWLNGSAVIKWGELRPEADVSELTAELARQLNLQTQQAQTEQELAAIVQDTLQPLSLLLIWDNCEHLHESCAIFATQLLENCPELRLLTTSRHPLQISEEICEIVKPLESPQAIPEAVLGRAAVVRESPAVQFFQARAKNQQPDFSVTNANAEDVAAICRRLDGLPLAMELVAPKISQFTPKKLRQNLDAHFWEMTGGTGAARKQQAMEATIAWSYKQLSPAEKTLFARLSVFVGGWTLDAALKVCANPKETDSFLAVFAKLQDHCLVQTENTGDEEWLRFRYLNTIRDYAAKKLREQQEEAAMTMRHREWCLDWARQTDAKLRGPYVYVELKRMEQEHDNLRAALDWACSPNGECRYGLKLACSMAHFWWVGSRFREGFERFQNLLQNAQDFPAGKANAQIRGGTLAEYCSESETARAWLEEGLAWARQNDSPWETAFALNALGYVNHVYDHERSMRLLQEGKTLAEQMDQEDKTLAEQMDNAWLRALLCSTQGFVCLMHEDYAPVRDLLEEGLKQIARVRDPWLEGELHYHLGLMDVVESDFASARRRFTKCLPFFEDTGDKLGLCSALAHLGTVRFCLDNESAAFQHWHDSVQRGKSIGYDRGIALSLDGFALLAAKRANHAAAVQLIHAADAMRARWNTPRGPFWKPRIMDCLAQARYVLGEGAYHSLADDALHSAFEEVEAVVSTLTLEQGGFSHG